MNLILRRCTEKDIDIVYEISNDPSVRNNGFNTSSIPYYEHCNWYKNSLNKLNRIMYLALVDKFAVGQIRLDVKEGIGLISYSISKNSRRKGYGTEILKLIKKEALKNKIVVLEGRVLKENIYSRKAFINNRFKEYEEETYFRYIFELNV